MRKLLLRTVSVAALLAADPAYSTITNSQNKIVIAGSGAQTSFGFGFVGVSASDISVIFTNSSGISTTLAQGPGSTQYQLTLNAPAPGQLWGIGGTVVYNPSGTPIPAGTTLTIVRDLPLEQTTSIQNQASFGQYLQATEQALDQVDMQVQQVGEAQNRVVSAPVVDPSGINLTLPAASFRANQLLGFDGSGNVIATSGSVAVISTAIDLSQTGPVSASTSVTYNFNSINIISDQQSILNGAVSNGLLLNYSYGGANAVGARAALNAEMTLNAGGTAATDTAPFPSAITANMTAIGNPGDSPGATNGIFVFVQAQGTATNYVSHTGMEVDMQMLSSSSANGRIGINLVSFGAVQGSGTTGGVPNDSAIMIGACEVSVCGAGNTASWKNAIHIGRWNQGPALDSVVGAVLTMDGVADTIQTGIDLSAPTISGNFLNSRNFSVNGANGFTAIFPQTGAAVLALNNVDSASNAVIQFESSATTRWLAGKDASGNFIIFDNSASQDVMTVALGGNMTLAPHGGTTQITGTLNVTTGYELNGTAGVNCSTITSSVTVSKGIVTHC